MFLGSDHAQAEASCPICGTLLGFAMEVTWFHCRYQAIRAVSNPVTCPGRVYGWNQGLSGEAKFAGNVAAHATLDDAGRGKERPLCDGDAAGFDNQIDDVAELSPA